MYEVLFDALLVAVIVFAGMAVLSRDLLKSVIFLSVGALSTAMVFFLLNAPDIAITKAAVEAGLTTAIFIVTIQKTARFEREKHEIEKEKMKVTASPSLASLMRRKA
jgi:energy-converting hydrogenase B subunit D